MAFRSIANERSPAATDIQDNVLFFQADLAANQFKLGFLRIVKRGGVGPVTAASRQTSIERRFEYIDGQVVVNVGCAFCAAYRLTVLEAGRHDQKNERQGHAKIVGQTVRYHSVEKLVERFAVPISIHIRLA